MNTLLSKTICTNESPYNRITHTYIATLSHIRYNTEVRRGARVVELARLERVCGGNVTQGSNPCLSAISAPGGTLP